MWVLVIAVIKFLKSTNLTVTKKLKEVVVVGKGGGGDNSI